MTHKLNADSLVATYRQRRASMDKQGSRLASMAKTRAKSKWGSAMTHLGPTLQKAVVAYEFASIIAGQEPLEKGGQAERIIKGAEGVV